MLHIYKDGVDHQIHAGENETLPRIRKFIIVLPICNNAVLGFPSSRDHGLDTGFSWLAGCDFEPEKS